MSWQGLIEEYRDRLPVTARTPVVTLLEGNTPLVPCERIAPQIGARVRVWVKFEGANPTGSFKDRGMTVAISKAVEEGAKVVACASTGNTSASAAAYAARAGLKCIVLIPEGKNVAVGKLAQAVVHGAQIVRIAGNFDRALEIVRELSESGALTLVNSVNPYRIEGQKTGAFEVCEQLGGRAPHLHCLPVGNAGNITAYWKGYREWLDEGRISALPRMWGFQAEGAAPIVRGTPVPNPETIATAIRIGNPASWQGALRARDESHGLIDMVSDAEILDAYRMLATMEGVFCEPSSAASVAGLLKMARAGVVERARVELGVDVLKVVCVLTGHGLKDPDNAVRDMPPVIEAAANSEVVARVLGM